MDETKTYLVIDLEATCDDQGGVPRHEMEIIEIGAVLVAADTLAPLDEWQSFVRPVRHPELTLSRLGPYGKAELDPSDTRGPSAFVRFRAFLRNSGRTLAHQVGLELELPRPLVSSEVRRRTRQNGEVSYTQRPGEILFFRHHPSPIFPTQEVYAADIWINLHSTNLALVRGGGELRWRIFADDAEPRIGAQPLGDYTVVQQAMDWVDAGA